MKKERSLTAVVGRLNNLIRMSIKRRIKGSVNAILLSSGIDIEVSGRRHR